MRAVTEVVPTVTVTDQLKEGSDTGDLPKERNVTPDERLAAAANVVSDDDDAVRETARRLVDQVLSQSLAQLRAETVSKLFAVDFVFLADMAIDRHVRVTCTCLPLPVTNTL